MLTEVHRQARDNPIIGLSMQVREGKVLEYGDHGAARVIRKTEIDAKQVSGADIVLVGRNRTRVSYNHRIREILGKTGDYPLVGDKLVCLRNNRQKGLLNGTLWSVVKRNKKASHSQLGMWVMPDDADRFSDPVQISTLKKMFSRQVETVSCEERRGADDFTYGYALTVHKAQGSQWPNVIVFDESSAFRDDAWRHLYTAITRAQQTLTIVR